MEETKRRPVSSRSGFPGVQQRAVLCNRMDSAVISQPRKVTAGTTEDKSPIRIWKKSQDVGTTALVDAAWKPRCPILLVLLCCMISSSVALEREPPTSSSNTWTFFGGGPSTSPLCLQSVLLWCRNSPLKPKLEALKSTTQRLSLHDLWKRSQPRISGNRDLIESTEDLCSNCRKSRPVSPSLTDLPAPRTSLIKASPREKKGALESLSRSLAYPENVRSKNGNVESPLALSKFENSPAWAEGDWHTDLMGWVNQLFGVEETLPSKSFPNNEGDMASSDVEIQSTNGDLNAEAWMDDFQNSGGSSVTVKSSSTPNQPILSEPTLTNAPATDRTSFGPPVLGLNSGSQGRPMSVGPSDFTQARKDETEALTTAHSKTSKAFLPKVSESLVGSLSTAKLPTTVSTSYNLGTAFSTASRIRIGLTSKSDFSEAITTRMHDTTSDTVGLSRYRDLDGKLLTPNLRSTVGVLGSLPQSVTDINSGISNDLATLGSANGSNRSTSNVTALDTGFLAGAGNTDKLSSTLGFADTPAFPFELVTMLNKQLFKDNRMNDDLPAALVESNEVNAISQFWFSSTSAVDSGPMPSTLASPTNAQTGVDILSANPLQKQSSELGMEVGVTEANKADFISSAFPRSPYTNQLYPPSGGVTVESNERETRFPTQLSHAATVFSIGIHPFGSQLKPLTGLHRLSEPSLNQNRPSLSPVGLFRSPTVVNPRTLLSKRTVPATNDIFNLANFASLTKKPCSNVSGAHLGSTSLLPNIAGEGVATGSTLQVSICATGRDRNYANHSAFTLKHSTAETTRPTHTVSITGGPLEGEIDKLLKREVYPLIPVTSGPAISAADSNPATTPLGSLTIAFKKTPSVSVSGVSTLPQSRDYNTSMLSIPLQNVYRPPLHSENVSVVARGMGKTPQMPFEQLNGVTGLTTPLPIGLRHLTSAVAATTYDSYITANSMGLGLVEGMSPTIPELSNVVQIVTAPGIVMGSTSLPSSAAVRTKLTLRSLISVTPPAIPRTRPKSVLSNNSTRTTNTISQNKAMTESDASQRRMTMSDASPVIHLSDLQVGAATVKNNSSKRTLPTEHSSLLSSESYEMKMVSSSKCQTCTSSNPLSSIPSSPTRAEEHRSSSAPPISITRPDFRSTELMESLYGVGPVRGPVTNLEASKSVAVSATASSVDTTLVSALVLADEQSGVPSSKAGASASSWVDNFTLTAFYDSSFPVKLKSTVKSPYYTRLVEGTMDFAEGKDNQTAQGATIHLASAGPQESSFPEKETPEMGDHTSFLSVTDTSSGSIGQTAGVMQHGPLHSWFSNATPSVVTAAPSGHPPGVKSSVPSPTHHLTVMKLPTNLTPIEKEPKQSPAPKPSVPSASTWMPKLLNFPSTEWKSGLPTPPSLSGTSIPLPSNFNDRFPFGSLHIFNYTVVMQSESSVTTASPQPVPMYMGASVNISRETYTTVSVNSTSFTESPLGVSQSAKEIGLGLLSAQSSKAEGHGSHSPITRSPFTTQVKSGVDSDYWTDANPSTPVISTGVLRFEEVMDTTTNLNQILHVFPSHQQDTASIASSVTSSTQTTGSPMPEVVTTVVSLASILYRTTSSSFTGFEKRTPQSLTVMTLHNNIATAKDSTGIQRETPSWPTAGAALRSTATAKDSTGFRRKTTLVSKVMPFLYSTAASKHSTGFQWESSPSSCRVVTLLYDAATSRSSTGIQWSAPYRSTGPAMAKDSTGFQKRTLHRSTVVNSLYSTGVPEETTGFQKVTPHRSTIATYLHSAATAKDSTSFQQKTTHEPTVMTLVSSTATANNSVVFQWGKSPHTIAMTSRYSTMSIAPFSKSTVMVTQRKHSAVSTIHPNSHIATTSLFLQPNSTVVKSSQRGDTTSASLKPTGSTKRLFNTSVGSTSHAGLKQSTKGTLSHQLKTSTPPRAVKTSSALQASSSQVTSPMTTGSTSIPSASDRSLTRPAFTREIVTTEAGLTPEMGQPVNETETNLPDQLPESDDPWASLYTEVNPTRIERTPIPPTPVTSIAILLQCRLTGIQYTPDLENQLSKAYKTLSREVLLTMNKIFSAKYGSNFFGTRIADFKNGSVIVQVHILFRKSITPPSGSDLVRTVVTEVYRNSYDYFEWKIDPSAVQANGYSLQNLEAERISVSFIVLGMGFAASLRSAESPLETLRNEVVHVLQPMFSVQQFLFVEVRNIRGDLAVKGDLYLKTETHADTQQILQALKSLVNRSMDLSSLSVSGVRLDLKIYPISFLITNRALSLQLMDHSSNDFQQLAKDLASAVLDVLKGSGLLQVVVRDVLSGSLLCRGDLIYQSPAPPSQEVQQTLIRSVSSSNVLGSSTFQVDRMSFSVADAKPDVHFVYPDFPGFAVAIIVMCGLAIISIPFLILLFMKTGVFRHHSKAVIQERPDPEVGRYNFELDNRGFRSTTQ